MAPMAVWPISIAAAGSVSWRYCDPQQEGARPRRRHVLGGLLEYRRQTELSSVLGHGGIPLVT